MGEVLLKVSGVVATITLNRPDAMNALTPGSELELAEAFRKANSSPAAKAIILTGAGRAFCAGADLRNRQGIAPALPRPNIDRFSYFRASHKPIFAAINGAAAGLGVSLALHCDFRYMRSTARLHPSFAKLGLAAEHGSAWLLPRLIGVSNAMRVLYGTAPIEAAVLNSMGLVECVDESQDLIATVTAAAEALVSSSSPRSVRVIREQILTGLDQNFEDAMLSADRAQALALESADFREGLDAFRENRTPHFSGE